MKNIAVILRAVPGSGKSTFARKLKQHAESIGLTCSIHSSDDKFMIDGEYKFDFAKLGYNHKLNHAEFCESMNSGTNVIIGDNTNIRARDYNEYVNAAKDAGYKAIVVSFIPGSPELHFTRGVHNVPLETITDMIDRFVVSVESADEQYTMPVSDGAIDSEYATSLILGILT